MMFRLSPLQGGQTVTVSEQCLQAGRGTVQLGDAHLNSVLALEGVLGPEPHWGAFCFQGFFFFYHLYYHYSELFFR